MLRLLGRHGFEAVAHGLKTTAGEVDLILIREDGKKNLLLLIEVKSLSDGWRAFERVAPAQLRRLRANRQLLAAFPGCRARAFVAWVERGNRVSLVEV